MTLSMKMTMTLFCEGASAEWTDMQKQWPLPPRYSIHQLHLDLKIHLPHLDLALVSYVPPGVGGLTPLCRSPGGSC